MQFLLGLSELLNGISHGNCSNAVGCLYLLLLIVLFKQGIVLPVAHFLHPRCDVGITCPETVKCDREKSENRMNSCTLEPLIATYFKQSYTAWVMNSLDFNT